MCSALGHVCYGPIADSCSAAKDYYFDQLRGEQPTSRHKSGAALRELHVPENRRSELENVPDVLSEGCRLNPFSPRHVCDFAESDLLDLVGDLLSFHLVSCAHPVGDELFELRDVRPAEPRAWTSAR